MSTPTRPIADRIAAHLRVNLAGCWICNLGLDRHGAAPILELVGGRRVNVRRAVVEQMRGRPLARGQVVRPCPRDTRCCNPAHTPIVTQREINRENRRRRLPPCPATGWTFEGHKAT